MPIVIIIGINVIALWLFTVIYMLLPNVFGAMDEFVYFRIERHEQTMFRGHSHFGQVIESIATVYWPLLLIITIGYMVITSWLWVRRKTANPAL